MSSFENDRAEMMDEISKGGDKFSTGLYIIALQEQWSFDKIKEILDTLDKLHFDEKNHKVETIKLYLNAVDVNDKAISTLFDLCCKDGRYKILTTLWKENQE